MSNRRIPLAACLVLCLALSMPAASAAKPVSGVVRTVTREGVQPAASIVYAERLDAPARPQPGHFVLAQQGKAFVPGLLAVPAGSTVDFPNRDSIFHNVFSLSSPTPFDLGLYRSGASRPRTFNAPAAYRVFCNIHPQMSAFILVAPTPHVTVADAAGAWSLDLPPGRYKIVALSERAAAVEATVDVGAAAAMPILTLDESRFVVRSHTNKFGQTYSKPAYRR